ncbi:MAG: T9SS type A sorting domain-containing protein [Flavobacteriales bacterium]
MNRFYTLAGALLMAAAVQLNAQVTVTFRVDVTEYLAGGQIVAPNGFRVGGNFADNSGVAPGGAIENWAPISENSGMTDQGNNIWSIEVTYPENSIGNIQLLKFVNGDWGANEGGSTLSECGVDDGFGGFNRSIEIPNQNGVFTAAWDQCGTLLLNVAEVASINSVNIYPNPAQDVLNVQYDVIKSGNFNIEIFNSIGQRVVFEQIGFRGIGTNIQQVSLAGLNAGIYFVKLNNGTDSIIRKVTVN